MSENPYQPPHSVQALPPKYRDLFDKVDRYRRNAFWLGIVLFLLLMVVDSLAAGLPQRLLNTITLIAILMIVCSLLTTIPLSIWGFAKGYREGKKANETFYKSGRINNS
jgi:hypothetical protein